MGRGWDSRSGLGLGLSSRSGLGLGSRSGSLRDETATAGMILVSPSVLSNMKKAKKLLKSEL